MATRLTGTVDPALTAENIQYARVEGTRVEPNGSTTLPATVVTPMLYKPEPGGATTRVGDGMPTYEPQRTMTMLLDSGAITSAGNTPMWTPVAGKRYRLMGFSVVVDPATTTTSGVVVTLTDSVSGQVLDNVIILGTGALTAPFRAAGILPSNGFLSPYQDSVLLVTLSSGLLTGQIRVNVWGCEE